jgi:hypothetical protein
MLAEKPVAVGARPGEREADGERKKKDSTACGEIAGNAAANIQPPRSFREVIAEPARRCRMLKKRLGNIPIEHIGLVASHAFFASILLAKPVKGGLRVI